VSRYAGGPFGRALRAYHEGDRGSVIEMRSDLGEHEELPVEVFFRESPEFFSFEREALGWCRGLVLDLGAGTGVHALELQRRGVEVVAVEIDPVACRILRERRVEAVVRADAFLLPFRGVSFDTVLMLMNGAGIAGTLAGLAGLLDRLRALIAPGGQLLLDSADLRPPADRAQPFAHRADGRYVGEAQIQLAFGGAWGEPFPELYVDPDTLAAVAGRAGWLAAVVLREEDGSFLARLTPAAAS